MKKILGVFLAITAVICCVFGLSACNGKVEIIGKTFIFESAEVTYADGVSEELKSEINVESVKVLYSEKTVTFNADGTVSGNFFGVSGNVSYTADGENYTVSVSNELAATVIPDKNGITLTVSSEGVTVTFKLKSFENVKTEDENTEEETTDNDITGYYVLYSVSEISTNPNVGSIVRTIGQEYNGVVLSEDYIIMTLNSDGTVTIHSFEGVTEEIYAFWSESEDGYSVKFTENADGSGGQIPFDAEYENGTLTLSTVIYDDGQYLTTGILTLKKAVDNEE